MLAAMAALLKTHWLAKEHTLDKGVPLVEHPLTPAAC
jgi:hypothetical protein